MLHIFDADGTLRRCLVPGPPFPRRQSEWELMPGVSNRMAEIDWSTNDFGLASNQSGVAKGLLTADTAMEMLVSLAHAVTGRWPAVGAVQMCPYRESDKAACRKPAPMMLWRIMDHYGVARAPTGEVRDDVLFVGDMETDRQAALAARVKFSWAWDFFGSTKTAWERAIDFHRGGGAS